MDNCDKVPPLIRDRGWRRLKLVLPAFGCSCDAISTSWELAAARRTRVPGRLLFAAVLSGVGTAPTALLADFDLLQGLLGCSGYLCSGLKLFHNRPQHLIHEMDPQQFLLCRNPTADHSLLYQNGNKIGVAVIEVSWRWRK